MIRRPWGKPWKWTIRSAAAGHEGKKARGKKNESENANQEGDGDDDTEGEGKGISISKVIVRGWICYAMVQASLFGAFLPPA